MSETSDKLMWEKSDDSDKWRLNTVISDKLLEVTTENSA